MTPQEYWSSVPSVDDVPAQISDSPDHGDSDSGELRITLRAHRRTLFKTAGILGTAFVLNALSWLPPARTKAAHATVGTEYLNCTIYSYDNIICTGAPYSRDYCGGDGWFLQYSGTCFASGAVKACNSRNAWRWTHNGTPYRCADGNQYWCGGSAFRICSWSNP